MKAQFQAVHAIIGGLPKIMAALGSEALSTPRLFFGTGAPTVATLPVGNGKYNAITNGFAAAISLIAGGGNYVVGDVLAATGGTGIALQITVDEVDAAGKILSWHTSLVGTYTGTFPINPLGLTGGSGVGANCNLCWPAPDLYLDISSLTAPTLYVCTTLGDQNSSKWATLGGGGVSLYRFKTMSAGTITCRSWDGTVEGATDVIISKPYKLQELTGETISGVVYDYSYVTDADGNRIRQITTISDDNFLEQQMITPPYLPNDLVIASAFPTGYPGGGGAATKLDLNVDARAWSTIGGITSIALDL